MSMQDTIADMLTRIRNAQMAEHAQVAMPSSKIKLNIAEVLKDEGYINSYQESSDDVKKTLTIKLKYFGGKAVIKTIKRVSRPGLRVYKKAGDIPVVDGGLGVAIVSTSKGVMSGKTAVKHGYGGEIMCIVA